MNVFENQITQSKKTQDAAVQRSKTIMTASKIFEMYLTKDQKINEEDFVDIYGEEEIKKDKQRVEYIKNSKGFEKPTPEGIVLENLFCDLAEKYKWFGEGSRVVQLSEFDDKIASGAHCDVVVEIPTQDENVTRIGIDLTTAINPDTLSKKRTKCLDGIRSGKLFSVKYFKSEVNDYKGAIDDVPVFIAGINKESLNLICDTLAKQENTDKDYVSNSEVPFMIFDEMISQASRYRGIAALKHGEGGYMTDLMDYYKLLLEWINQNRKSPLPANYKQRASLDDVYRYITKFS